MLCSLLSSLEVKVRCAHCAGVLQQASEGVCDGAEDGFQETPGYDLRKDSLRGLCARQL